MNLNNYAITEYSVDQLIQLALEQNIFIGGYNDEPEVPFEYTLKQLANLSFEQWAFLIEIENSIQ